MKDLNSTVFLRDRLIGKGIWVSLLVALISMDNATAQITFRKAIGNPGEEMANCVRQTPDNGYVICGVTSSADELSSNIYLLKTDESGNLLWSRNFGSSISVDVGKKVLVLESGELVVVGFTNSSDIHGYDILVLKTDEHGNELWRNTFGGENWDFGHDIILLPNGNYAVAGSTYSFGNGDSDGYFVEITPSGTEVRSATFGTQAREEFHGLTYQDDRLYFCGNVVNTTTGRDALVICADTDGNQIWRQVWGGEEDDYLQGITSTSDGNVIAIGSTSSNENVDKQLYYIKVTPEGQTLFERSDGGAADEEGREITEGIDGNYTVVGYTTSYGAGGSAMFFFTLSADGWWVRSRQYGSVENEEGYSIAVTQDGGFVLAGFTFGFGATNSDVFLVKTDGEGLTGATGDVVYINDSLLLSTAPPIDSTFEFNVTVRDSEIIVTAPTVAGPLHLELYNIGGTLIGRASTHDTRVVLDIRSVTDGVYIIRTGDSRHITSHKTAILR
jgi:hypothetical protein